MVIFLLFQYLIVFQGFRCIYFKCQESTHFASHPFTIYKIRITFRIWTTCYHIIPDHVVQCTINKFLFIVCCWIGNNKRKNYFIIESFIHVSFVISRIESDIFQTIAYSFADICHFYFRRIRLWQINRNGSSYDNKLDTNFVSRMKHELWQWWSCYTNFHFI